MKDEEYLFFTDARDKKNIARSARNQRTHTGKRGRVKLPSDYLTKKELNAMNGEVKSYRLNDPMTWKEFKSMPDDIKTTYIQLLRQKFNPYDASIAQMMGVHRVTFANEMKRLNLNVGKEHGGKREWDAEGWRAWCNGIPLSTKENAAPEAEEIVPAELVCECEELPQKFAEKEYTPIFPVVERIQEEESNESESECETPEKAIPCSGNMTFNGQATSILNTMIGILSGANVHITIEWEVQE